MYQLYFAPTPNGWKITIFFEEANIPYDLRYVNLGAGDQFKPEFLAISPNNRMPALVDPDGPGGESIALFESGAILLYLAEKTGQFLPADAHRRQAVLCWLFWQMGGLGPMAGQLSHFVNYAPKEGNDYAHDRYAREYDRLFAVMDGQLERSEWLGGDDFSIADMACFPWVLPYKRFGQAMDGFTHLRRWFDAMKTREGVRRGVDVGAELRTDPSKITPEARKMMFGQSADTLRGKKTS
ncbi:MAG: glutathione S-transferase N-terminal domain-containing protein [Gammaproteobacteria bacterium AqS3]|nr:glutathione S-transferase N-terminal domain-containing protein [Gammaproteobacteria bacterium AqS3]